MSKNTPNQTLFHQLCESNKMALSKTLVLYHDATWHIHHHLTPEDEIADHASPIGKYHQIFRGWEAMLRWMSQDSLKTVALKAFPGVIEPHLKAKGKLASKEALCVLVWNWRLYNAIDETAPVERQEGTYAVKNPLQRHSSIAGRTYRVTTPPADAKPYTSPAAMACLKIIKDCCARSNGVATEEQVKKEVFARHTEITETGDTSAWRFMQFYRPKLVDAGMVVYDKTGGGK